MGTEELKSEDGFRFKELNGNYLNLTLNEFTDMISESQCYANIDDYEKHFGIIGEIEIYNYPEKITNGFDNEKIEIVLTHIVVNYSKEVVCGMEDIYKANLRSTWQIQYAAEVLKNKYERQCNQK